MKFTVQGLIKKEETEMKGQDKSTVRDRKLWQVQGK